MFKLIKICVYYQNVMKTKANEEKVSPRETQYSVMDVCNWKLAVSIFLNFRSFEGDLSKYFSNIFESYWNIYKTYPNS